LKYLKKDRKKLTPVMSGKKSKTSEMSNSRSASRLEKSPDRTLKSPVVLTEHQIRMKEVFEEKAYMNVYHMLSKMFNNIENAFDEIKSEVDNTETLANFILQPKLTIPLNCDYID
jgi:hypothetical protein